MLITAQEEIDERFQIQAKQNFEFQDRVKQRKGEETVHFSIS